jgi:hypothetical protein
MPNEAGSVEEISKPSGECPVLSSFFQHLVKVRLGGIDALTDDRQCLDIVDQARPDFVVPFGRLIASIEQLPELSYFRFEASRLLLEISNGFELVRDPPPPELSWIVVERRCLRGGGLSGPVRWRDSGQLCSAGVTLKVLIRNDD